MDKELIKYLVVELEPDQNNDNRKTIDQNSDLIDQIVVCRRLEVMKQDICSAISKLDLYWEHNDNLIFELNPNTMNHNNDKYLGLTFKINEEQLNQVYNTNNPRSDSKKEKYHNMFTLEGLLDSYCTEMEKLIDNNRSCYKPEGPYKMPMDMHNFFYENKQKDQIKIIFFNQGQYNGQWNIDMSQLEQFFNELQDYVQPLYNQIKENKLINKTVQSNNQKPKQQNKKKPML